MKKEAKLFPVTQELVKKYYVFNETGNIMLTTIDINDKPSKDVEETFAEVSVFFAAMCKAISSTINPITKIPYSIYNYTAIKNVVDNSGLFVHISSEEIEHTSNASGKQFSTMMVKKILGIQNGTDPLPFAQSMIYSLGQECNDLLKNNSDENAANIFFICDYLLGLPIISAIVAYLNPKKNSNSIQLAPCTSERSKLANWMINKDTYLFISPDFIKKYAGKFDSITGAKVTDLSEHLKGFLNG